MKFAFFFNYVQVYTSTYQYVPVCTLKYLNLSSFENCHCHIVSNAKEMYNLYFISPDSFWVGWKTTDRLTISFIEISIEAGILLGGKHEACFMLRAGGGRN